jgi:hypothetical protein
MFSPYTETSGINPEIVIPAPAKCKIVIDSGRIPENIKNFLFISLYGTKKRTKEKPPPGVLRPPEVDSFAGHILKGSL